MASDTYGSFVITISRIIGKDIPYFMSFYLIVVAAFSCALSTLTNSGDPEAIYGFRALIYCFWGLIQVTVGAGDYINEELNCINIENVPDDLQWFYNILITLFYMAVQIMMLNLLIGMIGNTYNEYTGSSKSLLLLEKYNVTCSMERYLGKKEKSNERKKYAIELNEDSDQADEYHNNWAFDHVYFDKEWKNNTKEDSIDLDEQATSNMNKKLQEKIVLLIIMPQKDFHKGGSLAVNGANEDSERLAELIKDKKHIDRIDEIYVALDSHYRTHIAHAICWKHVETGIGLGFGYEECPFETESKVKGKEEKDENEKIIIWKEQMMNEIQKEIFSLKIYKWKKYSEEEGNKNYYLELMKEEKFDDDNKRKEFIENNYEPNKLKNETDYLLDCQKQRYCKNCISGSGKPSSPYKSRLIENLPFKKVIKAGDPDSVEYWYHPNPFTEILSSDLSGSCELGPSCNHERNVRPMFEVIENPNFDQAWALFYTKNLEKKNNYKLTIWPEHCIIGSHGHTVVDVLNDSLLEWTRTNQKSVQYIEKGQNCKTELYSILEAEVEDPEDPTTAFDTDLFSQLKIADRILICGQASSHCVKFTIQDLRRYWPEDNLNKLMLLKDCCSPVTSFEKVANDFIEEMKEAGLTVLNCKEAFPTIDTSESKTTQQKIDDEQDNKIKAQQLRDKQQDEMLHEIKSFMKKLENNNLTSPLKHV